MTGMPANTDKGYRQEHCSVCGSETPHDISMEIQETHTDTPREENRKFAKAPCRVTRCTVCEEETRTLQN